MRRSFLLTLLLTAFDPSRPFAAESWEPPRFSALFHLGGNYSTGFIQGYGPFPCGGIWLGAGLGDRFDGLWGIDHYTLPSEPVSLLLPSPSQPVSVRPLLPSDAFALSVNLRWYAADKWDHPRRRFNTVPYLTAGLGIDLVVDEFDRPEGAQFFNTDYDILFAMNFGLGMDFPMDDGKHWMLYAEALDHLIFWQGLTQILSVRGGVKFMLGSEQLDPFR